MAAEALDIKSLTSILLASPRTDIEQAVGRILREKHTRPLVIDIIDSHEVFKKQWTKRLKFYNKNKYKIITTTSEKYNTNEWNEIVKPQSKKKKTSKCLVKI